MADLTVGDFAYCDPPYAPRSQKTNFSSYSAGGFGPGDQGRLAKMFHALSTRGVMAIASNHATPEVADLYAGLPVKRVSAPRRIAANGSRSDVGELIVATWEAWG